MFYTHTHKAPCFSHFLAVKNVSAILWLSKTDIYTAVPFAIDVSFSKGCSLFQRMFPFFKGCSLFQRMFPFSKDVPFFKGCSLFQRMFPFSKDVPFCKGCSLLQRMLPFFKGIPLLNCFGLDPFLKGFPFTKGWENTFTCCRVLPSFALLLLWSSVSSPRLL